MATMMQKVLAPFHHHSSSSTQSQNTRSLTQSQSKRSPSPPSPSTKRPSSPSAKLPKYAVGDTVVVLDTFRNMQTVKITEILEPCPNNQNARGYLVASSANGLDSPAYDGGAVKVHLRDYYAEEWIIGRKADLNLRF